MALFIRDPDVDRLVAELATLSKAGTKTDAVRQALQNEIDRVRSSQCFDQRNASVMAMADQLGATNPAFDQKQFSDKLWSA